MEALACIAYALRQYRLYIHVYVLVVRGKFYLPGLYVSENGFKLRDDLFRVGGRNNALFSEHRRVGDAPLDILAVHARVEGN
ncbi:hypothetical protein SDC9_188947 [bioreactor metagenome]|uniref:Uncharacterized protein n=1 Tax=bioreactor metagenome TaxID=1076179 RepID=A0A645HQR4_9ZZZZ